MDGRRWWDRHPDRLAFEYEALRRAGITFEEEADAKASGVLRLQLALDVDGEKLPLTATFPDLYPYFRFEIEAPTLDLRHHQDPLGKNLCVFGRGTHNWKTSDTLADVISARLGQVLLAGNTEDVVVASPIEQHQAEPVTAYYAYAESMFILQSEWTIPADTEGGAFTAALTDEEKGPGELLPRGTIASLRDASGRVLAQADPEFLAAFRGQQITGLWLRVPQAPVLPLDEVLRQLLIAHPTLRRAEAYRFAQRWYQTWALVFPEETGWRGTGQGWVFINLGSGSRGDLVCVDRRAQGRKMGRERRR